jgi:hypothetical protein
MKKKIKRTTDTTTVSKCSWCKLKLTRQGSIKTTAMWDLMPRKKWGMGTYRILNGNKNATPHEKSV